MPVDSAARNGCAARTHVTLPGSLLREQWWTVPPCVLCLYCICFCVICVTTKVWNTISGQVWGSPLLVVCKPVLFGVQASGHAAVWGWYVACPQINVLSKGRTRVRPWYALEYVLKSPVRAVIQLHTFTLRLTVPRCIWLLAIFGNVTTVLDRTRRHSSLRMLSGIGEFGNVEEPGGAV